MRRLTESPKIRRLLLFLLGGTGVLCFAPFGLFWLTPFVCLAFFLLLRLASTARNAFLDGFLFGLGFFLAGVSWVYVSLSVFGGMPWWLAAIATFLFCGVAALYPALAAAAFKRWQPAGLIRQALYFGVLWMLTDWLRGWVFTGFPWLSLGYTQAMPSPLAGFAPLFGVYGLSLLTATLGALLAVWRLGVPLLIAALLAGWGLQYIEWTSPDGAPVSVALVQGNVPQDIKFRPEFFTQTLILYRDLVERHPAQITVLPETALPTFFDRLPQEFIDEISRLAKRQNGNILIGVPTRSGDENYQNSAVSLGVSPTQSYSKSHLVPFGEFIPPGFGWFVRMANIPLSDFSRGDRKQTPFAFSGQQVAANICYEDAFGEEIINALPTASILVNMSNTAWFGDSLAQPQHLQISSLRALETGRPMLRATNTGMTAVITPDGRVSAVLPAFTRGVLTANVQGHQGMTPYARYGNWLALALGLIFLLMAIIPVRGKSK
ncbi:MAG: Apolipoprotein N-acyltransferase [Proteobacteria bacterium]|nr:Apolipoprotein N-acyltransferase [Pseudomonadota bacterium]